MRRERDRLLGAILQSLARGDAYATRSVLATHVHVPYDRLGEYILELAEHELVTPESVPRVTARGRAFLREYEAWLDAIKRAGLTDPRNDRR